MIVGNDSVNLLPVLGANYNFLGVKLKKARGNNVLNEAWNGIVSAVSGGNEQVMALLGDLPGKILGVFSGAGSWLLEAGRSIINGLLDGLKAAFNGVMDFIGGIGDWIISHKGPLTYDRRMLLPAGKAIMGGLADGIAQSKLCWSEMMARSSKCRRTDASVLPVRNPLARANDQATEILGAF